MRFTYIIYGIISFLSLFLSSATAAETAVPCFAQGTLPDGRASASLEDWIENAQASRAKRTEDSFVHSAKGGFKGLLVTYFARFWTGTDMEAANAELQRILTSQDPAVIKEYGLSDKWNLWLAPSLYRIYFNFSANAEGPRAARLASETEKAILDFLWEFTQSKNDIAFTRMSTWWMTGSENHDLNSKVTCLLTSQIFKDHPDYRDRMYPNKGTGPGGSYWFHMMYGDSDDSGPDGAGDYSDGKDYGPDAHYQAWVDFFKEYIRERARKGFFVEVAASGYMKFTISFILDIRDYSEDAELRELAEKFLDAIWADWAIDQIDGHRGGAVTRWVNIPRGDSMHDGGRFLLGGYDRNYATHAWYSLLASDYNFPKAVWALALRHEAMGNFVFESRRPGEENPDRAWERPPGMERTILADTESRLLRYSYITPAFILGTQMDHPGALHSHLSPGSRWQGMMFGGMQAQRVYPAGFIEVEEGTYKEDRSAYFRSAQSGAALVVQQAKGILKANPEWFPGYAPKALEAGVHFGALGASAIEQDGWIFVSSGDAWLGVRPLAADAKTWLPKLGEETPRRLIPPGETPLAYEPKPQPWRWVNEKQTIIIEEPYLPILFQAGLKSDFPDLPAFQKHVLSGELSLRKIVVEGYFNVQWSPSAPFPTTIEFPSANDQAPRIDGRYIDYAPDFLFRSPYLNSQYGSGIITVEQGDERLVLDFNPKPSKNTP